MLVVAVAATAKRMTITAATTMAAFELPVFEIRALRWQQWWWVGRASEKRTEDRVSRRSVGRQRLLFGANGAYSEGV
jgi:hypothetical protein